MDDKDLRIVIDAACQESYDGIIKKTMILFDKGRSIIDMNKSGFKIQHRVDFAKGYAICGLYMIAKFSLNTTFRIRNEPFTEYLVKYRDDQLDKLSKRICDHFDEL